ncbi:MAG: bifunctional diaminohydroxyphosphoribosylaminopyrimidine deaminase/5-amino-6-(5-phosphoribosylamino)uracil reductase RibD [Bacteroidota bacterium]
MDRQPPRDDAAASQTRAHERWMRRCIDLAQYGAGHASPNPMVGSVIVGPTGQVLGEGYHERYGGLHAERNAIRDALTRHPGEALAEATLYVNLEPCNHHGKTPPCTDIVLEYSIPRVVVGMVDPFEQVAGKGLDRLRAHGVEVTVGVLEAACQRLNEGFTHHIRTRRPLVTLKVAQTLDGRIATRTSDSQWVTGHAARQRVHQWRSELDGVLVGAGTASADDPALTVRHVTGRQPQRFVLDRTGRLAPNLQLFTDAHAAYTTAFVGPDVEPEYAAALGEAGGRIHHLPLDADGHLNLHALLDWLGAHGGIDGRPLQSLLVEAGPGLATALWRADFVDRYACFVAPKLIGTGKPAVGDLDLVKMTNALTFADARWETVRDDLLFFGYRRPTV